MSAKQKKGSLSGNKLSLQVEKFEVRVREGFLRKTLYAFQHPKYGSIPAAYFQNAVKHFPEDKS